MKARTQLIETQPFAHDTVYKTCLGCGEIKIPVTDKLCADCDHIQRLQVFVNGVVERGNGGTVADKAAFFDTMYDMALPLVRE